MAYSYYSGYNSDGAAKKRKIRQTIGIIFISIGCLLAMGYAFLALEMEGVRTLFSILTGLCPIFLGMGVHYAAGFNEDYDAIAWLGYVTSSIVAIVLFLLLPVGWCMMILVPVIVLGWVFMYFLRDELTTVFSFKETEATKTRGIWSIILLVAIAAFTAVLLFAIDHNNTWLTVVASLLVAGASVAGIIMSGLGHVYRITEILASCSTNWAMIIFVVPWLFLALFIFVFVITACSFIFLIWMLVKFVKVSVDESKASKSMGDNSKQ